MGEGPLAISCEAVSRVGGALRLVRVRLVDGPGPGSARGVVLAVVVVVSVPLLVEVDCWVGVGGPSLKKFIGLREEVNPFRLRSGRLLRKGMLSGVHGLWRGSKQKWSRERGEC